jgi:DNA-binding winged helix-turn-helix (wHTH) protein/alpha-beta hydrolase superfamily lysophospholipase
LIYSFQNFLLDPMRRECRRGGELLSVEPQVLDILLHLIRNRDRVVSNDELIKAVWNGRVVSESTLSSRISVMRQVLGDSGEAQQLVRTFPRKGYRFVADVSERETQPRPDAKAMHLESSAPSSQTLTFCSTSDGVNLAVASIGQGPVVVRPAHWATSLEYDLQLPVTGPLLHRLASNFRVIRYDGRGIGLSERDVSTLSFQTMLEDLESAIDSLGLERCALLGISGGAATAISYAARHPERVSKLVLFGGYALGRNKRGSPQQLDQAKAFITMVQSGWGNENSPFTRSFFSFWLPTASPDQLSSFIKYQCASHSGDIAIKLRMALDDIDVVGLLPQVRAPTIIFHCIRDALVPFDQGRRIAAAIPGATFVPLDSDNHALLSEEPAWRDFVGRTEAFLVETPDKP